MDKWSIWVLVLGCLVTVGRQNIVLADDDELDPECEEETSQLLKYSVRNQRWQSNGLNITE